MAKMRVHELAKEFGVTSQEVLSRLRSLGEFVRSSSSVVEPPIELKLRRAMGQAPRVPDTPRAGRDRPTRGRGPTPFRSASPSRPTKAQRDAAAFLGVPLEDLRFRPEARRPDLDEWTERLFSDEEKKAWLWAGLGEHDAALADQCIAAGWSPEDLGERVEGRMIVERLRGGESVASIKARLAQERERRQREA